MSVVRTKSKVLVDEFTTPSPVVVRAERPVIEIMEIMEYHEFRHVPVVNSQGQPIGIISDRDTKMISTFDMLEGLRAADIMSPDPYVVSANTSMEEVALVMSKNKLGSAIVQYVDDNSLGIFTSTDALNALVEFLREGSEASFEKATNEKEISSVVM